METEEHAGLLNAPGDVDNVANDKSYQKGTERGAEVANFQKFDAMGVEGAMPWMDQEEKNGLEHVGRIRDAMAEASKAMEGMMSPAENQRALNWMTVYYGKAVTRAAKAKAMRDELFSRLLLDNPDLPIGRAKAISQGSTFGMMRTYYKNQAEGYLETMNTLKKNVAYYEATARNLH